MQQVPCCNVQHIYALFFLPSLYTLFRFLSALFLPLSRYGFIPFRHTSHPASNSPSLPVSLAPRQMESKPVPARATPPAPHQHLTQQQPPSHALNANRLKRFGTVWQAAAAAVEKARQMRFDRRSRRTCDDRCARTSWSLSRPVCVRDDLCVISFSSSSVEYCR